MRLLLPLLLVLSLLPAPGVAADADPKALFLQGQESFKNQRFRDAEQQFRASLQAQEKVGMPKDLNYAYTLTFLALSISEQGRNEDVGKLLDESIRIFGEIAGKDHPAYAQQLLNKAEFFYRSGKRDEAVQVTQQAIDVFRSSVGVDHPATQQAVRRRDHIRAEPWDPATLKEDLSAGAAP